MPTSSYQKASLQQHPHADLQIWKSGVQRNLLWHLLSFATAAQDAPLPLHSCGKRDHSKCPCPVVFLRGIWSDVELPRAAVQQVAVGDLLPLRTLMCTPAVHASELQQRNGIRGRKDKLCMLLTIKVSNSKDMCCILGPFLGSQCVVQLFGAGFLQRNVCQGRRALHSLAAAVPGRLWGGHSRVRVLGVLPGRLWLHVGAWVPL